MGETTEPASHPLRCHSTKLMLESEFCCSPSDDTLGTSASTGAPMAAAFKHWPVQSKYSRLKW